jgi:transposase InsO family protein
VGERYVWRLSSNMAIWSSFVKKSRSSKEPGSPVDDDLVRRDFSAAHMNELWFTYITEHPTNEGKIYLCLFEDAYSSRIEGYSIGERMAADLAVSALRNAIRLRDPKGTVVHSDRGSQPSFARKRSFAR